MNQFGKILGFELKYYFKNKIFVGVTVALALLIAAVMFFPRISDAIQSGEEEGEGEEKPIMLVHTEAAEDAGSDYCQKSRMRFCDYFTYRIFLLYKHLVHV